MSERHATIYLVLERTKPRAPNYRPQARVVSHHVNAPALARGQCAVKLTVAVPDEAFEPVLVIKQPIVFGVDNAPAAEVYEGNVMRAEVDEP